MWKNFAASIHTSQNQAFLVNRDIYGVPFVKILQPLLRLFHHINQHLFCCKSRTILPAAIHAHYNVYRDGHVRVSHDFI